jgi:hypothetical protein
VDVDEDDGVGGINAEGESTTEDDEEEVVEICGMKGVVVEEDEDVDDEDVDEDDNDEDDEDDDDEDDEGGTSGTVGGNELGGVGDKGDDDVVPFSSTPVLPLAPPLLPVLPLSLFPGEVGDWGCVLFNSSALFCKLNLGTMALFESLMIFLMMVLA